jgi:hypothetical protein
VFYRAGKYHDFYALFKKNQCRRSNLTFINFFEVKNYWTLRLFDFWIKDLIKLTSIFNLPVQQSQSPPDPVFFKSKLTETKFLCYDK